jgi:hypothetical protein
MNPSNDATFSLSQRQGYLSISSPGVTSVDNLIPGSTGDPRIVQNIEGNFTVETLIDFAPQNSVGNGTFQESGIVAWQDASNFLVIQRGRGGADSITMVAYSSALSGAKPYYQPSLPFSGSVVQFQLQRSGNVFTGRWLDPDGVWSELGMTTFSASSVMQVGLFVVNVGPVGHPPAEAFFKFFHVSCTQ